MSSRSPFADGFGPRSAASGPGQDVETLRLCDELSKAEGAEAVLVERVSRLSGFELPGLASSREVVREGNSLLLRSDAVAGTRLFDILVAAERRWLDPDLPSALALLQQVAASVAALHEQAHVAHGTLGPERIVVREDGSAVLVEAPLGAVLQEAQASRSRLWKGFRVAVPPVAGAPSLGQQADVMQLGVLALALARGRLLGRDDFPAKLAALLQEAAAADPLGHRPALPPALRSWVSRALQLDSRVAFRSASDASSALSAALAESGFEGVGVRHVAAWAEAALSGKPIEKIPVPSVTAAPPPKAPKAKSEGAALQCQAAVADGEAGSPRERTPSRGRMPARRRSAARERTGSGEARTRRPARVLGMVGAVAGMIVLWSGTYIAARSYLGFPSLLFPTGQLLVESRPAGLEVLLDGRRKGTTPLVMEVRAGRYTLALKSSRSTTLVPVTVEAGAWQTERIEIRRGRAPMRTSTVRRSGQRPADSGQRTAAQ